MTKRFPVLIALPALFVAGAAPAQDFPVVDMIAQKLIAKYQNATCEQLWEEKATGQGQPKSQKEQRGDPDPAGQSADAAGAVQPGGHADRHQDVPVRDDSLIGKACFSRISSLSSFRVTGRLRAGEMTQLTRRDASLYCAPFHGTRASRMRDRETAGAEFSARRS